MATVMEAGDGTDEGKSGRAGESGERERERAGAVSAGSRACGVRRRRGAGSARRRDAAAAPRVGRWPEAGGGRGGG